MELKLGQSSFDVTLAKLTDYISNLKNKVGSSSIWKWFAGILIAILVAYLYFQWRTRSNELRDYANQLELQKVANQRKTFLLEIQNADGLADKAIERLKQKQAAIDVLRKQVMTLTTAHVANKARIAQLKSWDDIDKEAHSR